MEDFEKWDLAFRNQNLYAFNESPTGILWLKIRAITRGKQLQKFAYENHLPLSSKKISQQQIELFNILKGTKDAAQMLDDYLNCMNHEWYFQMGVDIDSLKEDLYKVQYYLWGGDQNNSLDKYLISRYVKTISRFSELQSKQIEIAGNAWNYVQNSWYNNWTSFIIESLFKRNPKVISAVGEIKSVDFFIEGFPLDLKVTFFPHQFMEEKFKRSYGTTMLSWLKRKCKEVGVTVPVASANQQLYILTEKLTDYNHPEILDEFRKLQRDIIQEAQTNPSELITWLYENQGEMRFGAENRIYLILADSKNLEHSWKLKRAFPLIEPIVKEYLQNFSSSSLRKVKFQYKKKDYTAFADTLFVVS